MPEIKLFEAFAGYGSQAMALSRAGIPFEHTGFSEIDKYAITAHKAVHGNIPNYGDIRSIDEKKLPDFNLFTYSFPCQSVSVSGRQEGIKEGTRSGLLWECERIIKYKRPRFLIMENVKNLISKKHKPDFLKWCIALTELGYTNYYQVLNAKHHGVPQNRERVFMISILGDHKPFIFPEKEKLNTRLKNVLENQVDEKYYLSEKVLQSFAKHLSRHKSKGNGFGFKPHLNTDTIAKCIGTHPNDRQCDNYVAVGIRQTGRNPDKPTSRKPGLPTTQMLESNDQEISNCITTVQKDAMVGIVKVGNCNPSGKGMNGDVYHENGLCPTLTINKGEGPKIMQSPRGFNKGGEHKIAPSITSSAWQDNNFLAEPTIRQINPSKESHGQQPYQQNRVYDTEGILPALSSELSGRNNILENHTFRIRKLTPLEVFRLMDVSDKDFHLIRNALIKEHYHGRDKANSQLYKMAGNSIVVRCLEKIFTSLLTDNKPINEQQLKLF